MSVTQRQGSIECIKIKIIGNNFFKIGDKLSCKCDVQIDIVLYNRETKVYFNSTKIYRLYCQFLYDNLYFSIFLLIDFEKAFTYKYFVLCAEIAAIFIRNNREINDNIEINI